MDNSVLPPFYHSFLSSLRPTQNCSCNFVKKRTLINGRANTGKSRRALAASFGLNWDVKLPSNPFWGSFFSSTPCPRPKSQRPWLCLMTPKVMMNTLRPLKNTDLPYHLKPFLSLPISGVYSPDGGPSSVA